MVLKFTSSKTYKFSKERLMKKLFVVFVTVLFVTLFASFAFSQTAASNLSANTQRALDKLNSVAPGSLSADQVVEINKLGSFCRERGLSKQACDNLKTKGVFVLRGEAKVYIDRSNSKVADLKNIGSIDAKSARERGDIVLASILGGMSVYVSNHGANASDALAAQISVMRSFRERIRVATLGTDRSPLDLQFVDGVLQDWTAGS